jgi:probable phosphoglycerate mutase
LAKGDKKVKRIYLVRHFQTVAPEGVLIGQTDVALSLSGAIRAAELGQELSDISFDRVFVSPLSRCRKTAKFILGPDFDLARLEILESLKEIDLGSWEGLSSKEIKEKFPDIWEQRGQNPDTISPPGGESFNELAKRVRPAWAKIVELDVEKILVVAHQAVNRVILADELGISLKKVLTIEQPYGQVKVIDKLAK